MDYHTINVLRKIFLNSYDLAHDSSVVHFYFDDLFKEKESAFEAPSPIGNTKRFDKRIKTSLLHTFVWFAVPHFEELTHFWFGFIVAMMLHYFHKIEIRFLLPYLLWFLPRNDLRVKLLQKLKKRTQVTCCLKLVLRK